MNHPIHFGKYLLLDKVGSGGMAELFLAKQMGLSGFEKVVAIKRILPHLTQGGEFIEMFINEAKLAALLSHQNIVQIYDLGSVEASYYIAMEYVMGRDLRSVLNQAKLKKAPISIGDLLLIVSKICSALDYAHRKKDLNGNDLQLVHRDISPQNILVSYEGEVKLVDFGIAKAAMGGEETKTGVLKGKLAYMSPEQAWGKPVDRRTDIFALGIVLYEAVTGERLFKGNDEISILEKVRKAEIMPPTRFNPAISPELEKILFKALAREAEHRYQSAGEMQVALEEIITQKGYAFSSLSLSHFMQSLHHEEIERDTTRFQLITAERPISNPVSDRSTLIRQRSPLKSPDEIKEIVREPTLASPRRRTLSRSITLFFFLASSSSLLLMLLLSDLTFSRQLRKRFPPLESAGTTVHNYLDDLGFLARLDNFKTGLFSFSEGKKEVEALSTPPTPEENAPTPRSLDATSNGPPRTEADFVTMKGTGAQDSEAKENVFRLFKEAKENYNAGHLEEVERNLRQIIEIDPKAVMAYHLLGTIYQERDPDLALRLISEAAALFPMEGILHYDLGFLYSKKGLDSLATQELILALKLAPQAPDSTKARNLLYKLEPRSGSPSSPRIAAESAKENEMKSLSPIPAQIKPSVLPPPPVAPTAPPGPSPTSSLSVSMPAPSQGSEAIKSLIMRQKKAFETKNLTLYLQDHVEPSAQLRERLTQLFERRGAISVNYEIYELKTEGKEASVSLLETIALAGDRETQQIEKALVYWKLAEVGMEWKIKKINVVEKY